MFTVFSLFFDIWHLSNCRKPQHSVCFFASVVTCPIISSSIQAGTVQLLEGNGRSAGSLYSYVCDIGYMISGPPLVYCNSSGVWTHPVPSCRSEYIDRFSIIGKCQCDGGVSVSGGVGVLIARKAL